MSSPILECVPNFSEGRDSGVIEAIAAAIRSVEGAKLLDVDPGKSTNRTVYTFAGDPEAVLEAAFQAAKVGIELIDMRRHRGEHPRFGALDVCPLVPIANCTMDDAVRWAKDLSRRLADELGLTIFNYGHAASSEERSDLASVRAGEYEGLPAKLEQPEWQPDFGPARFNEKSGATAVGARDILVAYNVNLNTTSTRRANAVAFDVRERGRAKRLGDPLLGEIVRDEAGEAMYEPGVLKNVKGIGWFIEEYGVCQVSLNLTNIRETPVHVAFEETSERARERGLRATGSELVGLIPLACLLEAGRFYLHRQNRSSGVSDEELVRIAVRSLGLDELSPFDPRKKVIEYALQGDQGPRLGGMTLRRFVEETASESPAPGGGSVAAAMGALGAALATMVANLSSHKRGWDERWREFSDWADRGKLFHEKLLRSVDDDTDAFDCLIAAYSLPKSTEEERKSRDVAIHEAARGAIEVPLEVMRAAVEAMEVARAMAETGNPNSVSDAGVGAIALRSAVWGAALNVKINLAALEDEDFADRARREADDLVARASAEESAILAIVEAKIAGG